MASAKLRIGAKTLPWATVVSLLALGCADDGASGGEISAEAPDGGADTTPDPLDEGGAEDTASGGESAGDGGAGEGDGGDDILAPDAGPGDDDTTAEPDAGPGDDDAGSPDAAEPADADGGGEQPDAGGEATEDAGAPDGGAVDAGGPDIAEPDTSEPDSGEPDAGQPDVACGNCPFSAQPKGDHPAATGDYDFSADEVSGYGPKNASVLILRPEGSGPFPVLGFLAGKQLFEGGGSFITPNKLGHAYRALLEHAASRGYMVVFVRVEQSLLDADHARMADDFLATLEWALDTEAGADPSRVAYAGHSMGAKVALIAGVKATEGDVGGKFSDPTALFLFAYENSAPPVGTYIDARSYSDTWDNEDIWVTFVDANDDAIAPWASTTNPNAATTYTTMSVAHKQIVVLEGTGTGDTNPATNPVLADDHAAPMTIVGKNGGAADFIMPNSALDALDWYGYWKILIGGMDYHFQGGSIEWAYGALRTHGGALPNGSIITHTVAEDDL